MWERIRRELLLNITGGKDSQAEKEIWIVRLVCWA